MTTTPDDKPKDEGTGSDDRLEDLFVIGQGGMATVHASRLQGEGGFQKLVAVKRMRAEVAESDKARLMFLDEARVAAHIQSPHVVPTLDLGRSADGTLYIVMELVLGPTLSQVMAHHSDLDEPVPLDIALELLAQTAEGLDDAHEAVNLKGNPLQVVHRDVTPRNVLLGLDGRIRVTDFGIAQARQRLHQTQGSEVKGTFAYMSPEQLRGGGVDRRSDLFALGSLSFELITGQRLFAGKNPLEVMENVLLGDIPPLRALRPDVPEALDRAVARVLDREPKHRFATAQEFAEALRETARSTVGRPAIHALRDFAQAAGGRAVGHMQSQLATTLASSRPPPPKEATPVDYTEPDVGQPFTQTVTNLPVDQMARDPRKLVTATTLDPPAIRAVRSPRVAALAALTLLLAVAVLGLLVVPWEKDVASVSEEGPSTATASGSPAVPAEAVALPGVAASPEAPPGATVPGEEASPMSLIPETEAQGSEATRPEPSVRQPSGFPRPRRPRTPSPRPVAPTAMDPSPRNVPSMRGGLEGLDAFDRYGG